MKSQIINFEIVLCIYNYRYIYIMSLLDELVLHINKVKQGSDSNNVEIEFRYNVDRRKWGILSKADSIIFAQFLITNAMKAKKYCEVQQTINFLAGSNLIKRLMFTNGVQDKSKILHYTKIDICQSINADAKPNEPSFSYKIASVVERKVDEFPLTDCKQAKIKLRFSITETDTWRIDITLVKNVDISQPEEIKTQRDIFIKKTNMSDFVTKSPWNDADHIEFEAEFIGKKITKEDFIVANNLLDTKLVESGIKLDYSVETVNTNMDNVNDYQKILAVVGQYILKSRSHKGQNISLKQIGNQPIELNRSIFFKDVLPTINQFYITDKVDGQRCIVFVDKKVSILTDNVQQFETNAKGVYIFDGEYLKDDVSEIKQVKQDQHTIYLFDVMMFAGKKVSDLPFRQRLAYFEKIAELFPFVKLKPFTLLTDKYAQQIISLKKEKRLYETDGYVLTPANGTYENMSVYKYKPIDKLTIDFLIKKCPQKLIGIKPYVRKAGEYLYILFCGMNKATFYSLNVRPIRYYDEIFPTINYKINDYFPMQFETSDCVYAHIYKSTLDNLDGEVGEFRLLKIGAGDPVIEITDGSAQYLPTWELVRVREDRRLDVANGTYFGNNSRIAELIWYNYKYPIVIEALDPKDSKEAGYFQAHDSEQHKASRNFNSFVKSEIFKTFQGTDWVLDLASGKGQDLARYRDNNVKNLVCVEIDPTAIVELISRKYDLVTRLKKNYDRYSKGAKGDHNTHNAHELKYNPVYKDTDAREGSIKLFVEQLDLTNAYAKNIEKLDHLPINKFDIIVCNFAFHYFLDKKATIKNVIKFIAYYLKPGGRFIFTSFDGQAINELLKNGDWLNDSYGVKKCYKGNMLLAFGQKISARLPVSNGQFYDEYLVNIDYLKEEFAAVGMDLETNESFGSYLPKYKGAPLTDIDKQFVSLYYMYRFYKKPIA